jgi:hypothetical protein
VTDGRADILPLSFCRCGAWVLADGLSKKMIRYLTYIHCFRGGILMCSR